ncbi:MAG: hypothetical protein Q9209_002354 [Squamulea sp. 1 TL-2023]
MAPSAYELIHNNSRMSQERKLAISMLNFYRALLCCMPLENMLAISMEYFHLALVPGKVFPQQRANHPSGNFEHFSKLYRPADLSVFSAMNRSLYQRFRELFWSQNTWVIGPGTFSYTVAWLDRIPADAKKLIRNVEINFTIMDFEAYLVWSKDLLAKALGQEPLSDDFEPPDSHLVGLCDHGLQLDWSLKFRAITGLELDELTLDFMDAVSLDGSFIGSSFAENWLWREPFVHQFPRQLNIWAPNGDLRDEIYDIIRDQNIDLLSGDEVLDLIW